MSWHMKEVGTDLEALLARVRINLSGAPAGVVAEVEHRVRSNFASFGASVAKGVSAVLVHTSGHLTKDVEGRPFADVSDLKIEVQPINLHTAETHLQALADAGAAKPAA